MAFAPGDPLANWIILLEIEVGHRIDGDAWTQGAAPYTDTYYCSHTNIDKYGEHEGKPSRVKEDGVEYTEEGSLSDCHDNASTWYWDATNKRLYVHTSGGEDPSASGVDYIILSYIWRRFASKVYIYGGKPYLPFIAADSIPAVAYVTGQYHEGQTRQTFGSISLLNGTEYFDTDLSSYIYEGKRLIARVGKDAGGDAGFGVFWDGWTGDIEWTEEKVTISVEDLMTAVL